jgi:hypothetical protein
MKALPALLLFAVSLHAADLIEHAKAHADGKVAFSFDASAWSDAEATRHLPIGCLIPASAASPCWRPC